MRRWLGFLLAMGLCWWLSACSSGNVASVDAGQDANLDAGQNGDPGLDAGGQDDDQQDGDAGEDADDGGVDAGVDGGGDEGSPTQLCEALPAPSGTVINVNPSQANQLRQIILDAQPGTTILLADGTYDLSGGDNSHRLSFYQSDVTLRSASGNPEAVVLDGNYGTGELVYINASRVTIAELTLRRAYNHTIHVTGGDPGIVEETRIYRVRIFDAAEQAIKINTNGLGKYADNGTVACCHVELTDSGRGHVRNNCYTGGIDAHQAWGWVVRDNFFKGIWCPSGLAEHGVHFWTGGRDTLVERNTIVDCARGIGFGLGENGNGDERSYDDDPYPEIGYIGHTDGIIRNNFIAVSSAELFASETGYDAGITLDQAHGALVIHNTIASTQAPFSSIEWRYDNTQVRLINNLTTHDLRDRGGEASLAGNRQDALWSWFVDPGPGNLHLKPGVDAIDAGVSTAPGECDQDIDHQARDDQPDQGADEFGP